jgi:salicylate hydroxylase
VTPNSSKILQRWELPERIWASAAEPTSLVVHRYSGQVLAMEPEFDRKMRARYGAPFVDLHRVDVQLSLYDRAAQLGVAFKLGEKVESINFDLPEVTCASGMRIRGDLVVAADGLWSQCRNCFLGRDDPPKPTGDLAYRIVLNLSDIDDPELRSWVEHPACHFWIGPNAHAVGYSLKNGNMYNIVLLAPDDLPEGARRQAGSVEEMRERFKSWDPVLTRFLMKVKEVEKWRLMHSKLAQAWAHRRWLTF